MSDKSDDQEGDIFDNIDSSIESNNSDRKLQKQQNKNDPIQNLKDLVPSKVNTGDFAQQEKDGEEVKQKLPDIPLPILEGAHSLGPDMKFGWKPEVDFESAPIPLYFNFLENPLQSFYEEQAYYSNSNGKMNNFKIIYYGPRFKDSFEMHKNFVKPAENTYEFAFPKFFGQAGAKAFYDGIFEEMLDGEAPRRDEMREFQGMSPDVEWNELCFNSNFENGNLDMVVKTGENTYDLFLRIDTNTRGHTNWFHFEVSKTKRNRTVKFNIVNMNKKDALFNHGMLINYWSQKKNSPSFCGWERGGMNIKYFQTSNMRMSFQPKQRKFYTLSFDFKFEHENDKIWFAYTIPYSYSMCIQYIRSIVNEQKNWILAENARSQDYLEENQKPFKKRGRVMQDSVLCKTLGGVDVPLLTITNFDDFNWQRSKKVIFVQSRIHPGETSSSWIVHGLISFLISRSKVADQLRKRFIFKIVPMLNPDGVIIGNSRATLLGTDMNRQFMDNEDQDPKLNPVPIAIKEQIANLIKEDKDKILAFIDLHQHSKKKSIFIYGPYYPLHTDKYLKIRIIPKLLSERSEIFRFFSSRFRIEKYKENCARITIGKQFNIVNCFTMECSSFGYITKDRNTIQFKESDLIEFGKSLAECLLEYELIMERDRKIKEEIKERIKQKKKKRKTMKEILGDQTQKAIDQKQKEPKKEKNSSDEESDESGFDESGSNDDETFTDEYIKKKKQLIDKGLLIEPNSKALLEVDIDDLSDDDEDRFYSDEEEDANSSPVSRPSDLKGLLKHKQKKSKFDLKSYSTASTSGGKSSKIRTLDQILGIIQNDVIHEESENDSNPSIGSQDSDQDGSDSSGDDNLDMKDQQILKDRILHAIQVFSKWSPNPKKELMKQKRKNKLSIENRSRASSRRSNGSDSHQNLIQLGDQNEIQLPFYKNDQKTPNQGQHKFQYNKRHSKVQQKKQVIDSFLQEIGFISGTGINISKAQQNSLLNELDDDALSSISNEILKQKKKNLKKQKKQTTTKSQGQGDLLMVKSFGTNKNKKNSVVINSLQSSQDYLKQSHKDSLTPVISDISGVSQNQPYSAAVSARKIILLKFSTGNEGMNKQANSVTEDEPYQNHGILKKQKTNNLQNQVELKKEPLIQKLMGFNEQDGRDNQRSSITEKQEQLKFEMPKSRHLFGYDNKLALLNQAIENKKKQQMSQQSQKQIQQNQEQQNIVIRPKSSFIKYHRQNRSIQQYVQFRAQTQENQIQPTQKPVQIPTVSNHPNTIKLNSFLNQHNKPNINSKQVVPNNLNGSFENVPPPFFSCQIQPQVNKDISNHLKQRRNLVQNLKQQASIKVNAATDTNQIRVVSLNLVKDGSDPNLMLDLSQISIDQSPKFKEKTKDNSKQGINNGKTIDNNQDCMFQSQLNENHNLTERQFSLLQPPARTSAYSITDSSYTATHNQSVQQQLDDHQIHGQANKQLERQIISSQSKKYKFFEKNQNQNQHPKVKGKNVHTNKSSQIDQTLQEYLASQSIGLHQWMSLKEGGHIQSNPNNQLIITNITHKRKEVSNTQFQVSIQKDYQSHNTSIERRSQLTEKPQLVGYFHSMNTSPNHTYIKQDSQTSANQKFKRIMHFNGNSRPQAKIDQNNVQQYLQGDIQDQVLKVENNQLNLVNKFDNTLNRSQLGYSQQQISKGRPQSMVQMRREKMKSQVSNLGNNFERSASNLSDLVIKNEHKQTKTRFKPFVNIQNASKIMEFLDLNKSQIVKEILLKSGGQLLGRPDVIFSNNALGDNWNQKISGASVPKNQQNNNNIYLKSSNTGISMHEQIKQIVKQSQNNLNYN